MLEDLRQTAKMLGKDHVSCREYAEHGRYDPSTFYRRFGSWNNALREAGLVVKKLMDIPEPELMRNLKCVWDSLGRQPRYNDMAKPFSDYDIRAYTNRYGSWNNALDAFAEFIERGGMKKEAKPKNRKRSRASRSVSKGMRFDIFKRDKYKCVICGRSPATEPQLTLHVDHIVPLSKGGETTLSNLQTLCSECNLGKGPKSMKN